MKPQPLDFTDILERIDEIHARSRTKWERELAMFLLELLDDVEKRVESACEFYLKYRDNPELLMKEVPKYELEVMAKFFVGYGTNKKIVVFDILAYNKWLFKLAFKFDEKCIAQNVKNLLP